ncbi:MAG: acetoin utilization deacetylase AcuC-like enzyme [Gammaproteobacteria bacterium]|jgi:acetoin utilization deacetylase AcuC-like enzyme
MSERISVFFDPAFYQHDTGSGFFEAQPSPYLSVLETHPENADRLRNMEAVLKNGPVAEALDWYKGEPANHEDLLRFHSKDYIDELAGNPVDETRYYSGTTVFGPGSFDICCKAAGMAIKAAETVFHNENRLAYALVRPPGHHAQPAMADGYCFLNNIGVALEKLRSQGLRRAVVIDWDVHHGNGTQEGFYDDPDILTISMHMDHGAWGTTHPQTGSLDEVGRGKGLGKNLNLPMPYGSGDHAYNEAFKRIIAPIVIEHQPELIVIASGQDANQFDPNGRQLLSMAGFNELGRQARALADECCDGKLLLVQEGGYAISYAAYCLHATPDGVLNRESSLPDPLAYMQENKSGVDIFLDQLRVDYQNAVTTAHSP